MKVYIIGTSGQHDGKSEHIVIAETISRAIDALLRMYPQADILAVTLHDRHVIIDEAQSVAGA